MSEITAAKITFVTENARRMSYKSLAEETGLEEWQLYKICSSAGVEPLTINKERKIFLQHIKGKMSRERIIKALEVEPRAFYEICKVLDLRVKDFPTAAQMSSFDTRTAPQVLSSFIHTPSHHYVAPSEDTWSDFWRDL